MDDKDIRRKMLKEFMLELVNGMAEDGKPGAKAMKYSIENDDLEMKIIKNMELDSHIASLTDSLFEQVNSLYKDFIKEYIEK